MSVRFALVCVFACVFVCLCVCLCVCAHVSVQEEEGRWRLMWCANESENSEIVFLICILWLKKKRCGCDHFLAHGVHMLSVPALPTMSFYCEFLV